MLSNLKRQMLRRCTTFLVEDRCLHGRDKDFYQLEFFYCIIFLGYRQRFWVQFENDLPLQDKEKHVVCS